MKKRYFLAYVFVGILSLAFTFNLPNFNKTNFPEANYFNGEWSEKYEQNFGSSQFYRNLAVSLWKKIKFNIFNESLEGAVLGKKGWIFTNQEFIFNESNFEENKNFIEETANTLSEKNINILILPIPSKARLYQIYLNRPYPTYLSNAYDNFLSFLRSENIKSIDILSALENEEGMFFKTDTHWTPQATKQVADKIKRSGFIALGKDNFNRTHVEEKEFVGDLLQYVDEQSYSLEQLKTFNVIKRGNGNSLFADKYFPIVLVGTSYSANKNWGVEGNLKFALQQDILNVSEQGEGPFKVMKNYLEVLAGQPQKPEYIIWEIPERYLMQ